MDECEQGHRGRRMFVGVVLLVVVATGVTLRFTANALTRGQFTGPNVHLQLGDFHLIAETTMRPECLPLTQHECFVSIRMPPMGVPPSYTVWAGRITRVPAVGQFAGFTVSSGRQLLKLPIRREETRPR